MNFLTKIFGKRRVNYRSMRSEEKRVSDVERGMEVLEKRLELMKLEREMNNRV